MLSELDQTYCPKCGSADVTITVHGYPMSDLFAHNAVQEEASRALSERRIRDAVESGELDASALETYDFTSPYWWHLEDPWCVLAPGNYFEFAGCVIFDGMDTDSIECRSCGSDLTTS